MINTLNRKIINTAFALLQAILILIYAAKKDYWGIFGPALVYCLFIAFLFYERRNGIVIPDLIRYSVFVTVLSNSYLGEYLRLYYTSQYFDKFLHIFGTFSFSVFLFILIERKQSFIYHKRYFLFIFVLLLGTFTGTIFEILEFISDLIFKTVNQNGLIDTDLDLISDVIGAALAGIWVVRHSRAQQQN